MNLWENYEMQGFSFESCSIKIKVIGIGESSYNYIEQMIKNRLFGVDLVGIKCPYGSSIGSNIDYNISISQELILEIGKDSEQQRKLPLFKKEMAAFLKDTNFLITVADINDENSAEIISLIAEIVNAKETCDRPFTSAVVTSSFKDINSKNASNKIMESLFENYDSVISISKDKFFNLSEDSDKYFSDIVSEHVYYVVRSMTDIFTLPSMVGLDFADIKSVLELGEKSLMGYGYANGENRAVVAAEKAIAHPLLENELQEASGCFVSVIGGSELTIFEVNEVAQIVGEINPEAHVTLSALREGRESETISVTIIATGVPHDKL